MCVNIFNVTLSRSGECCDVLTHFVHLLSGLAGGSLPVGILQQGSGAIQDALTSFDGVKRLDKLNERRPGYEGTKS